MSGGFSLFFCQELGLVIVKIVGSASFTIFGFLLDSISSSSFRSLTRFLTDL